MSVSATVRLLELEPDLARFMTQADAEALDGLAVPVIEVPAGELDLAALLSAHHAFAMILLDGMLVRRIVVGESATLRLLGPGDIVSAPPAFASLLLSSAGWRAAAPARLAVLGREILLASHRAPRLVAGLHVRGAEQADRVAVQLAICQMPRVEDRVLSLLWLLAESWGQVTAHGTALRLHLTHETLGGLVGARRSTVTLALGQLTDAGAILRQDRGWLLLESPASIAAPRLPEPDPQLLDPLDLAARTDARHVSPPADVTARIQALREAATRLSAVGDDARLRLHRDLRRLSETRLRSQQLREEARARRRAASGLAGLHQDDHAGDGVAPVEGEADDGALERLSAPVDGLEH